MKLAFQQANFILILLLIGTCDAATDFGNNIVTVQRTSIRFSVPPKLVFIQGSGVCIDPRCSVIATTYHAQLMTGRGMLGVKGARTVKVVSLANQNDTNRATIRVGDKLANYNLAHDIAFVYTRKPVPYKVAPPLSYHCSVGENVYIVGLWKGKKLRKEARVLGVNVRLLIGNSELGENIVLDGAVPPGTSGGPVFDGHGNLLGMMILTGRIRMGNQDQQVSVALPIRTLANALMTLDPPLAARVFNDLPKDDPKSSATATMSYQDDTAPADAAAVVPELSARPAFVADAVRRFQTRMSEASRQMVNLLATQCLRQWKEKPLCHEVSIVDGKETFREIAKSGKPGDPMGSFPRQKQGIWGGSEWFGAGESDGAEQEPWVFEGIAGDRYLFTLRSRAEDNRCRYAEYPITIPLFGHHRDDWEGPVDCVEKVLTDRNFNIVAMFTEMTPPDTCLTELFQSAVDYDWVRLKDTPHSVLLPVRERISAKVENQKTLMYSEISWTDYRRFGSEHKIRIGQKALPTKPQTPSGLLPR
jgi:Trypsin-like peptidase domain